MDESATKCEVHENSTALFQEIEAKMQRATSDLAVINGNEAEI